MSALIGCSLCLITALSLLLNGCASVLMLFIGLLTLGREAACLLMCECVCDCVCERVRDDMLEGQENVSYMQSIYLLKTKITEV